MTATAIAWAVAFVGYLYTHLRLGRPQGDFDFAPTILSLVSFMGWLIIAMGVSIVDIVYHTPGPVGLAGAYVALAALGATLVGGVVAAVVVWLAWDR